MSGTPSCRQCLSRRDCLRYLGAAAGLAAFGGARRARAETPSVDPATLRPRPRVTVTAAILQLPEPYWLGWPGTTYDLAAHRREYLGRFAESCARLGITGQVLEAPIQDDAGVDRLLATVTEERPDALLVILQHMHGWTWVDKLAGQAGVPLLVFAPVGTAFTGHVDGISRRAGVYVVSSLRWSAVEDGLRMVRAKRMFEDSRILWIHGNQDNETVLDRLGTRVRAIPRDTFNHRFDATPASEEAHDVAADLRAKAMNIVEPTEEDTVNCARAYLTAKALLAEHRANALSMDCLGMVGAKLVPTPPCGAWTLLQDQGITAGCEADLFGATSLMLSSFLLDRPGFMNDPVPETASNHLIVAHCTSGTRLNGFDQTPAPYILRDHSESSLGVSMQVLWPKDEPVTLIRFTSPHEVIVDTGAVVTNVNTPPAGGCRTSVELAMDDIEDCRDVRGFHQVVVLGHHRRLVEAFGQLYGIRVVRSPRFARG